jgi:tRNA(Ile2) C34 agmatinyltransferase TiaS
MWVELTPMDLDAANVEVSLVCTECCEGEIKLWCVGDGYECPKCKRRFRLGALTVEIWEDVHADGTD